MSVSVASFLFLAAAAVGLFAFLSIAAWVGAPAKERLARERYALLKSLAEQPGENASRVLDLLRREEEELNDKKARDERRGWIDGGLILINIGVGLGAMVAILGNRPALWSVGLMPTTLGAALLLIGLLRNTERKSGQ